MLNTATEIFEDYAEYYNLLYGEKNYAAEADYVDGIIKRIMPNANSILDLGCGTGRHAYELFVKGYSVTGIDISDKMLNAARTLPENDIEFLKGDIRTVELDRRFDIVISLFHVLSYQQTDEDVIATFNTIKKHLKPGGVFICDCWYGPGVMNDKPIVRSKEFENEKYKIVRKAEPEIHYEDKIVDVNYSLLVYDKETMETNEIHETHKMRYFFIPEFSLYEKTCGIKINNYNEWMTDKRPNKNSWNICFSGSAVK